MLKQRIITALILAAAFFAALFGLSTLHFAIVLLIALMAASWEWGKLTGQGRGGAAAMSVVPLAVGLLLLFATGFDGARGFGAQVIMIVCGGAAFFWIVIAPVWLNQGWKTGHALPMAVLGAWLIVAMWMGMVQLHARSPWLLLAVMLVVWVADIAAYFAGRKFGRRKLAPTISPGKSWEGVYGALASVLLYAVLMVAFSHLSTLSGHTRALIVIAALLLAAVSVVGDLFESWLKRQAGVKDSGNTLPGHGGVLDRVDALIPVLPVATLAVALLS